MKKILSLILVFATSLVILASCASKEEQVINDLQVIATLIEEKGDILTDEQWDKTVAEYQAITDKIMNEKFNFTDEQKQQISKLEAKCFGELTKHGAKRVGKSIQNILKEGTNAVKGLIEGLTDKDED